MILFNLIINKKKLNSLRDLRISAKQNNEIIKH